MAQESLTPTQRGVRDHFVEGGSMVSVLLVVAFCALMIGLVYLLTRRSSIRSGGTPSRKQLFRSGLDLVPLSDAQRSMLCSVVSSERVENPCVLLLSRPLFDRHVDRWLDLKHRDTIDDRTRTQIRTARELRAALFPPR